MFLSQPIENIDQELSQLYALIETKKAYQATLIELDAKADDLNRAARGISCQS